MKTKIFLNPKRNLVDEVVSYVETRARAGSPAPFFDHLLIVVPTAESSRTLRLALAKKFPALLSPRVVQPSFFLKPADESIKLASDIEMQAAFLSFVQNPLNNVARFNTLFHKSFLQQNDARAFLNFFDQLTEIWRALANNALTMSDVPLLAAEQLALAEGLEEQRWQELAEFESAFFSFLNEKQICPYPLYIKHALENPMPLASEIEEIILPSLVDPIHAVFKILTRVDKKITLLLHANESEADKFDEWGIPKPNEWSDLTIENLSNEDIFCASTNEMLGEQVAESFDANAEKPTLGLIDSSVFVDVHASLLNHDIGEAYQPERHELRVSSLGEIVSLLFSAWQELREGGRLKWQTFKDLLQTNDVMTALLASDSTLARVEILKELSQFENKFFPIDEPSQRELNWKDKFLSFENLSRAQKILNGFFNPLKTISAFTRAALALIYPKKIKEKEFVSAALATNNLLNALEVQITNEINDAALALIAQNNLTRATYQLEADNDNLIKTLGWLELSWTKNEQVALIGFHEGSVPDTLVGHAFLPNSLRAKLGLVSNELRFARDAFLFSRIFSAREPHNIKVFISRANASGDIQKPSRLLFLCDNKTLPARVKHIFDEIKVDETKTKKNHVPLTYNFPTKAKLKHAKENFLGALSPSAIDTYLFSPFFYFLKYACGFEQIKIEEELPANDYGSLAHAILENFANQHLNKNFSNIDETLVRSCLENCWLEECKKNYGEKNTWSTNLSLQLESLKNRILSFSKIQKKWFDDGWQIFASEYKLEFFDGEKRECFPFANHPDENLRRVALRGSIDRIDFHPSYGFRLIDFKTWNEAKTNKVISANDNDLKFAEKMDYPTYIGEGLYGKEKRFVLKTIQLPLYARALEAKDPNRFANLNLQGSKIIDLCYVVLGKDDENTTTAFSFDPCNSATKKATAIKDRNFLINMRECADKLVDKIIHHILNNHFYPLGADALAYEFAEFFEADITKNLDESWVNEVKAEEKDDE